MINTIKLYLYGGITLAISIFIFIFRSRGSKIDSLKSKITEDKETYKNDLKVAKFEVENDLKAKEAEREIETNIITDGNYSL